MLLDLKNRLQMSEQVGEVAVYESLTSITTDIDMEMSEFNCAVALAEATTFENYQTADNDEARAEVVALYEGVLGDVWAKIKSIFKKLWDKIKGWWNTFEKWIRSFFMGKKEFLKKYKSELEGKSTDKFEYEGYKYALSKLNTTSDVKALEGEAVGILDAAVKALGADSSRFAQLDKDFKVADKKKEVDAKAKSKGVADFKTNLIKEIRGGKTSKSTIKSFGANSLSEMISFIEKSDDAISDIKETQNSVSEILEKITDKLDTVEKGYDKISQDTDNKSHYMTYVRSAAEVARYTVGYGTAALDVQVSMVKEIAGAFDSVLRSFLRYSPKKESFGGEGATGYSSLLEQTMNIY